MNEINKRCYATCEEKGRIIVKMPLKLTWIENKETAVYLVKSILFAIEKAWPNSENEFTLDGIDYVAIESDGLCDQCCFYKGVCKNKTDISCSGLSRNDKMYVIWKIK